MDGSRVPQRVGPERPSTVETGRVEHPTRPARAGPATAVTDHASDLGHQRRRLAVPSANLRTSEVDVYARSARWCQQVLAVLRARS